MLGWQSLTWQIWSDAFSSNVTVRGSTYRARERKSWNCSRYSPSPTYSLTAGVDGAPQMTSQRFLHFSLFSTALWDLANSRPVHSLMLFSNLFFCLPCLLPLFTVPCKMILARPDERETCPVIEKLKRKERENGEQESVEKCHRCFTEQQNICVKITSRRNGDDLGLSSIGLASRIGMRAEVKWSAWLSPRYSARKMSAIRWASVVYFAHCIRHKPRNRRCQDNRETGHWSVVTHVVDCPVLGKNVWLDSTVYAMDTVIPSNAFREIRQIHGKNGRAGFKLDLFGRIWISEKAEQGMVRRTQTECVAKHRRRHSSSVGSGQNHQFDYSATDFHALPLSCFRATGRRYAFSYGKGDMRSLKLSPYAMGEKLPTYSSKNLERFQFLSYSNKNVITSSIIFLSTCWQEVKYVGEIFILKNCHKVNTLKISLY